MAFFNAVSKLTREALNSGVSTFATLSAMVRWRAVRPSSALSISRSFLVLLISTPTSRYRRSGRCLGGLWLACPEAPNWVLKRSYAESTSGTYLLGLAERRDAAVLVHGAAAGVVGRHGQIQLAAVLLEQLPSSLAPPRIAWRGSLASVTPRPRAVAGINCISPLAPACETAPGLNFDSVSITAAIRAGSTPYFWAASCTSGP